VLISFEDIRGFTLMHGEEALGSVKDLYFDDQLWIGSFLVVDAGSWFSSNKFLLSMREVSKIDPDNFAIQTPLTQQDVESAPPVNAHLPVSEQKKQQWYLTADAGTYLVGAFGSITPALMYLQPSPKELTAGGSENVADRHLRSGKELLGYSVLGPDDDDLGSVSDLIIDSENLEIQYLVIDTGHWLPGRLVVIAPQWSTDISWAGRAVRLQISKDPISEAPPLSSLKDLHTPIRASMHEYYGYPMI